MTSLTTAGVPAMAPGVSNRHTTPRSLTLSGRSRFSALLYRLPSGSWLYIGQSFGSPETTSTPLGTLRSSHNSTARRRCGRRRLAARRPRSQNRDESFMVHLLVPQRLTRRVGDNWGMKRSASQGIAPTPARRPIAGRCRAGEGLLGGKDPTGRSWFHPHSTSPVPGIPDGLALRWPGSDSIGGREDAGQRVHDKGAGFGASQFAVPRQAGVYPGRVHDVPGALAHEQVGPLGR